MKLSKYLGPSISILALCIGTITNAQAGEKEEIIVLGKRIIRKSAGATGLDLSLRETPQSVTIVTSTQIKDFAMNDVNQLLANVTGINVESVETDRTYFNSRGFDIINFQIDGTGQPLDWGLQYGAIDTAIYDRIEAIRGANGMMTGTGNPSATINYIRKRPTEDFRANASFDFGSFDNKRFVGDISGPLNSDGTLKARFVYSNTDSDSHLDYYTLNRNLIYGVLSWEITPKFNATIGYSHQDNLANGNNWGALPLVYSDGSLIEHDVSATTAAPWTYWDTHDKNAFIEASYAFDNGFTLKASASRKDYDDYAKLLYVMGNPDRNTGDGLIAMSGYYPGSIQTNLFDIIANGKISLFGRQHQIVMGANRAVSDKLKWEAFVYGIQYPNFNSLASNEPIEPNYPSTSLQEDIKDELNRAYAAIHLNMHDRLKSIIGFNAIDLKTEGYSYGVNRVRDDNAISTYFGLVYDISPNISAYFSYSDIFNPQSEGDINRNRLDAAKGESYELGLKTEWLEKRFYATAALFKTVQKGLAQYAGYIPGTFDAYYVGVDTYVKGAEFELSGKINPNWNVSAGLTSLEIEDANGDETRLYLPRHTLKISSVYSIKALNDLKLGGAIRWQSEISTLDMGVKVSQKSYAILDLMASMKIAENLRANVNIKNATDEKYFASLKWEQAFYAAPRTISFGIEYKY